MYALCSDTIFFEQTSADYTSNLTLQNHATESVLSLKDCSQNLTLLCYNSLCSEKFSFPKNSWFENSHLQIENNVKLTY